MERFKDFSLYVESLKSFGSNRQGFDELKHINLIVGRNNTGKSALIDLIQCAVTADLSAFSSGREPRIFTTTRFGVNDANMFGLNVSGGSIGRNHHEYGIALIGTKVDVEILGNRSGTLLSCGDNGVRPVLAESGSNYPKQVANSPDRNPICGLNFHRLAAERNVMPELDNSNNVGIDEHGNGATNLIQRFINKSDLPSELVQDTLLGVLNEVFAPDAHFTFIVCRQHQQGLWEVYLQEASKGRIALSNSGSGIKTVLLVLAYIHLLPVLNKQPLRSYVFAFEELENNYTRLCSGAC